nr:aldolase/citrate lyase family protein [uncultured Sphingomonas sp.]
MNRYERVSTTDLMDDQESDQDIIAIKGEFEAEGLSRDSIAAETIYAARLGLGYLVKIGGCEAKSDMRFLRQIGIKSIVAPMIESAFAMSKYQAMLPEGAFDHVGVTIETIDAVDRIEAILDAGVKLTEVTVGRTDLTASYGGSGVESPRTIEMVKTVARAAKARGLKTTMGGSVGTATRELLLADEDLRTLISCVETRKCVMPMASFLKQDSLEKAFEVEADLLSMQSDYHSVITKAADARLTQIRSRL